MLPLTENPAAPAPTFTPTAIRQDGSYLLNGEKWLISPPTALEYAYVIAVTDPNDDKKIPACPHS